MRPLRADEIDIRVGQVRGDKNKPTQDGKAYQGKATFLLYKNARVDMTILDEEFNGRWQRDHKEIKGNLFCGIGIYSEHICDWIWKWDCGTESNTEAEKGEASDSFKRAGFCWGIGRELYTAPKISLPCPVVPNGNGWKLANPFEFNGLYVREFETEELDKKRVITHLSIWARNTFSGAEYPVKTYDLDGGIWKSK